MQSAMPWLCTKFPFLPADVINELTSDIYISTEEIKESMKCIRVWHCAYTVYIYPLSYSASHSCVLQRSAIRADTDGPGTITLALRHTQVEVIDFPAQSIGHILLIKWLARIQSFIDKNHLISCHLFFTSWCRIYLWRLLIKIFQLSGYQSSWETLLIPSEMGHNPDLVRCCLKIYGGSNLRDVLSTD